MTLLERLKAIIRAWRMGPDAYLPRDDQLLYGLESVDRDRVEKFRLLWKYYDGDHKQSLRSQVGEPNDNVILNVSARIVDKGIAFLFGKPMVIDIDGSMGRTTPTEELLSKLWSDTDAMMSFFHLLAMDGGVTGTAFVHILLPEMRGDPPRFVVLDPALVFPTTDPDDVDHIIAYEIRWASVSGIRRLVYALDDGGRWQIAHELLGKHGWEATEPVSYWPFPWAPVVHCQNLPKPRSIWGKSDLEDADLNDAINAAFSDSKRLSRIFGSPLVWGYGFGTKDVRWRPGAALLANSPSAQLHALDLNADVNGSIALGRTLMTDMYILSRVPEMSPENMRLGAMSGFALRVLYSDLLEKTQTKRRTYGALIKELVRRGLDVMGQGYEHQVEIAWPDPLPEDKAAQAQSDKFDLDYGLASKETVARRRGYDWEAEQQRIEAEQSSQETLGAALIRAFNAGKGAP